MADKHTSTQHVSIFKPYSVGLVASPKPTNSKIIQVTLRETMPYMSGSGELDSQVVNYNGKDKAGNAVTTKVVTGNTVPATWVPFGSNRLTPPDVRDGEKVMVYRAGDEDEYYWSELGLDDGLRRLETIVIGLSGSPQTRSNVDPADGSWYFIEWSSHQKHLLMSNSKLNGEVVQYTVKFDYGQGTIGVSDDLENSFLFDSINRVFQFINQDKCLVQMNQQNINILAQDTLSLSAVNAINLLTNKLSITANSSVGITTNTFEATAPGGFTFNGPIRHTGGNLVSDGDGIFGGVSVQRHEHTKVQNGGDVSGPPVQ